MEVPSVHASPALYTCFLHFESYQSTDPESAVKVSNRMPGCLCQPVVPPGENFTSCTMKFDAPSVSNSVLKPSSDPATSTWACAWTSAFTVPVDKTKLSKAPTVAVAHARPAMHVAIPP